MMGKQLLSISALCAAALMVMSTGANAAAVTSRAGIGETDFIEWAQLGSDFGPVPNPAAVTTNLGVNASVSIPSGTMERRDQGSGWGGNFAPGDALLWTAVYPGPLTIDFATGLFAVGAQIQRNTFGQFSAEIAVYDSSDVLLESFQTNGNSTSDGDNSAIFIGISRATADIDKVRFNVTQGADFAINRVSIGGQREENVPEPGTMALLGLGLLGAVAARRRKAD